MSLQFMLAIAVMYVGAAMSFGLEGKWGWCAVSLCWGAGNAILGLIGR
jgi:hypothetical protein